MRLRRSLNEMALGEHLTMYIKDKQKLVSKSLFKKLQLRVLDIDLQSDLTLDVVAREVLKEFEGNEEIQALTEEQKEKLHTYLQIGYSEPK